MHMEGSSDGGNQAANWFPVSVDTSGRIILAPGSVGGGTSATAGSAAGTALVPVGGKDGSGNAQFFSVDTSGNQQVIGNVAGGVADSGNPLKVGGKASSVVPTAVTAGQRVDAWFDLNGRAVIAATTPNANIGVTGVNTATAVNDSAGTARPLAVAPAVFNGGNLDLQTCNQSVALLVSAARTTAQNVAGTTNVSARGVQIVLNVTVASGTGGLTLTVQAQDPVSANWYSLNANPTAVTATGTFVYEIYPGAGAAAGGVTQSTSRPLPRTWRVSVAVGDASSYTYSVSANLIV